MTGPTLLMAWLAVAAAQEQTASVPAGGDPCAPPADTRAPDLRCQEGLDGRAVPGPPSLTAPRLLLRGPQLASRVLFWPVVRGSALVESYRLFDWARAILTSDDGRLGLRPELQYRSDFLPTVGARVFYRPPGAEALARFHTAGQDTFLGEFGLRGPTWLGLGASGRWSRRSDRLYAGLGAVAESDLEARGQGLGRYRSDVQSVQLDWSRALAAELQVNVGADLVRREFSDTDVRGTPLGDLYDPATVPGFTRGDRLAHVGGGLQLHLGGDRRDGGGVRLGAEATYARGLAGDPSRHLRLDGDTVVGFGGLDRALLLRLQGAMVEALGPAPVSFEELIAPAGAGGLRGLPDGRLRGPSGLVASVEYRWFIAFNLDASLFVDLGTVAGERFAGLGQSTLFPSVGLGIRRFDPGPLYWQAPVEDGLQVVYSPEAGWRLLLSTAAF
jgi:hypothetical protein